jgi:hypothetical protein
MMRCWLLASILVASCAPAAAPRVPAVDLQGTRGEVERFPSNLTRARWTVVIFLSADCPCFKAHEPRLAALARDFEPKGVRFLLVDSERESSASRAERVSIQQRLALPLVIDSDAVLADALRAEYATYSVVLDAEAVALYRGGIDSDKSFLREDATPYLRDALDDLLAGRTPRRAETEALGCVLATH